MEKFPRTSTSRAALVSNAISLISFRPKYSWYAAGTIPRKRSISHPWRDRGGGGNAGNGVCFDWSSEEGSAGHTDSCATGSQGKSQTIQELRRNFLAKKQAACKAHSNQLKGEGQKWLTAQEKLSAATFPSVDQDLTAKSRVQPQSEQEGHGTGKLRQLNSKITYSAGQWILLPSLARGVVRCHSTLGIYIQGIRESFDKEGSQINKRLTEETICFNTAPKHQFWTFFCH